MSTPDGWDRFTHELRRHIREVVSESQLILQRDGDALHESARSSLARIAAAGASCDALIRAMNEFQGADPKLDTVAPLDRLLRWMQAELRPQIAPTSLAVHFEGDCSTPVPVTVTRVVEELIRNAAKFGASDIQLRAAAAPDISFEVRDDGLGFPMEYRSQIFEPFRRLHAPDDFPGHGLGLAIAARLARMLGGSLDVTQSAPGEGSIFTFHIPGGVTGDGDAR